MRSVEETRLNRGCRFCAAADARDLPDFDMPVASSRDCFAIASIGGFVPGWTLVCPKRHILNLASLYETSDLVDFSRNISAALERTYGRRVVVFEHGAQRCGSAVGCGTDHAHLHLVPLGRSLRQAVAQFDPGSTWLQARAQDALTMDSEYLLMADGVDDLKMTSYIRRVTTPESQYFRRVVAGALNREQVWNYRTHPFVEMARETASRLRVELQAASYPFPVPGVSQCCQTTWNS